MIDTLASRLQSLRKKNNLTQIELADTIGISKSQYIRYENKNVQPPANILNKLADKLDTTVDFIINGHTDDRAKAALKNTELLQRFKEVDTLPEVEQNVLLKVISAYLRDFKAKQAYTT
jgi:transcriptional regulator with XRE-family HTH domain